MKIKCPICDFEFDEGHSDIYILGHITRHYSNLIQKIHDTIEKVELGADGDSSEMTSYECDMAILQTLKSLLESEK